MRAVRKRPNYSRWLSVLLCVCIILPDLNGFTLAAQIDGQDGLCEHHRGGRGGTSLRPCPQ